MVTWRSGQRLQVRDDSKCKVRCSAGATHVWGLGVAIQDGLGQSIGNLVCMFLKTKVTEHHDG